MAARTARKTADVEKVWTALRAAGLVVEHEVTQLFDPTAGIFLADRFVSGTCPNPACHARTSTATVATVRHDLQSDGTDRSGQLAFRRRAGATHREPLIREYRAAARVADRVDREQRGTCSRKWPTI